MLLGEGRGFEIAQGRLGPGRIHPLHALYRSSGAGARNHVQASANESGLRESAGGTGNDSAGIASSRMEIEQARLLTLKAAYMMDTGRE